ncbi:hypothetical protein CWO91_41940 [Bradyrhizobium genosp. SA-3]|uniref:acetyl-CoA carboxylase biotin carboxyl carrier protein subunit n=1 Tax=Bradyrhizobium genosp. SA-3 TaxID=508868 RepID=UPI001029710E|nr:acetyl-CoA carboxylase biotin carboxyl carrier protein subunit [Bradyrhizobium genosp. SA-3]RZM89667.1 hypothetical protein CWO91_41940 [Bradyrhizobium genosp. SA-3]
MSFTLNLDGKPVRIEILRRHPKLVLWIDGQEHVVGRDAGSESGMQVLDIDGRSVRFARAGTDDRCMIRLAGQTFELTLPDANALGRGADDHGGEVRAPMPGTIVSIHKSAGEIVNRGDALLTIESMKLQMALSAPRDGVVAEILHQEGGRFDKDDIIARLVDENRKG